MNVDASARTVMERCEILASYSEEPDRLTRRFATKAMLFVRCRGGISHNPAESVTIEDVEVAINVIERFVLLLSTSINLNG